METYLKTMRLLHPMDKMKHILLVSSGLFLVLFILILSAPATTSEPVHVSLFGKDGREFFHPGEEVKITVQGLDNISSISVKGNTNLSVDSWSGGSGNLSAIFPAPSLEGNYILTVEGFQDGKPRTETAHFFIEGFELFVFPEKELLISNQSFTESALVHLELVDWKGDPISGEVNISIARSNLKDSKGEKSIENFSITVPNSPSFSFTPAQVTNSTFYHIRAEYMDYPASECGIVVQPFPLDLKGERTIIDGGAASINGPFLRKEMVRIVFTTPGQIVSINVTDAIDGTEVQYSLRDNVLTFSPSETSIYQLWVTAKEGDMCADGLMFIPVNDWPITLDTPGFNLVGGELKAVVIRENGAFFGVRALLLNETSMPISGIRDLIEKGASGSPFYEKGLLNSQGRTTLHFRLPTNMKEGEYLLMVGLGSWDEEEISYHGITFSRIRFQGLHIEVPEEVGVNEPLLVTVYEEKGGQREYINGTLTASGKTFVIQEGKVVIRFDSPGMYECLASRTGRDVTSFAVKVFNHTLELDAPDYVLNDQEFCIRITNESGIPLNRIPIKMTVTLNNVLLRNESIIMDPQGYNLSLSEPGNYLLRFKLGDHASSSHALRVLDYAVLSYPERLLPDTNFTLSVQDPEGNNLSGLALEVDGGIIPSDSYGTFTLSLPPGTHHARVLSRDVVLVQEAIYVEEEPTEDGMLERVLLPVSGFLLILFFLFLARSKKRR